MLDSHVPNTVLGYRFSMADKTDRILAPKQLAMNSITHVGTLSQWYVFFTPIENQSKL